jgi:dethiobiotin synthetase/adenosylmethionine--8-amino-7-oxononanoate aminotransferase
MCSTLDVASVVNIRARAAVARLVGLGAQAFEAMWWPTTQHGLVRQQDVHTIDSRSGEHFNVLRGGGDRPSLEPLYDGCASWWTQVRPGPCSL